MVIRIHGVSLPSPVDVLHTWVVKNDGTSHVLRRALACQAYKYQPSALLSHGSFMPLNISNSYTTIINLSTTYFISNIDPRINVTSEDQAIALAPVSPKLERYFTR